MEKENISKSVLLPGDPLRARFIAENYIENPVPFEGIRGIIGYTGIFKEKQISVMGSGMGIPSVSISAYTLYSHYDVQNIIRIGTCGTAQKNINIGDILIASGCSTTSGINSQNFFSGTFCPVADFEMLRTAVSIIKNSGKEVKVGNLLSTDLFYDLAPNEASALWWNFGVLGVEMEGAGLYTAALRLKRRALMICTVSDTILDRQGMSPKQRETSLHEMISLGLDTISKFS